MKAQGFDFYWDSVHELIDGLVQGGQLVGVIGGATDVTVLKRITDYAMLKYRRRYLLDREWSKQTEETT